MEHVVFRHSDRFVRLSVDSFGDAEIEHQLSWRYGELHFSHESVSTAASEFNRYNRVQIAVSGSFDDIKIEEVFRATDPLAFARGVCTLDPTTFLEIDDSNTGHVVLRLTRLPGHGKSGRKNTGQRRRELKKETITLVV